MDALPKPPSSDRRVYNVIGCMVDAVSTAEAVQRMGSWAAERESRVVCICNAHVTVTTTQNADFHRAVANSDLVTPDGAPVAWMLQRLGARGQERVTGPDLMLAYCEHASRIGESLYLYGSTPQTLELLKRNLLLRWPHLRIAGMHSPPFRPLTEDEDAEIVRQINESGASTVWVGLGCPKQELWMAQHRGQVNAVMVGVGAAFAFHAGLTPRAPEWMRDNMLEWLHRLASEPRRLWRRYLTTNALFLIRVCRQLLLRR